MSKGSQLVTVAPPSGGVYVIAPSPGVAAALSAKATPQLWHRRYGHMGYVTGTSNKTVCVCVVT